MVAEVISGSLRDGGAESRDALKTVPNPFVACRAALEFLSFIFILSYFQTLIAQV